MSYKQNRPFCNTVEYPTGPIEIKNKRRQANELYLGAKLSHLLGKGKISWTLKKRCYEYQ
jgi:uncharacterized protein YqiB (DUF1249 family)